MKHRISPVMTMSITIIACAIIFGGFGYYVGGSRTSTNTFLTPSKTYTNSQLGFSFQYPSTTYIKELKPRLVDVSDSGEVLLIVAPDFTAHIELGPKTAETAQHVLNNASKNTTLPAKNLNFFLLDSASDPTYVSAYAPLEKTAMTVIFDSIKDKGTLKRDGIEYTQNDLPQSAKDLLASFSKM